MEVEKGTPDGRTRCVNGRHGFEQAQEPTFLGSVHGYTVRVTFIANRWVVGTSCNGCASSVAGFVTTTRTTTAAS
jgi:hypothetical protein